MATAFVEPAMDAATVPPWNITEPNLRSNTAIDGRSVTNRLQLDRRAKVQSPTGHQSVMSHATT